eukprot:scaffold57114_cov48-Phaeocystis_antarctica.AAC.1
MGTPTSRSCVGASVSPAGTGAFPPAGSAQYGSRACTGASASFAVFFAADFDVFPETEGQSIAAGCGPSGSRPAGSGASGPVPAGCSSAAFAAPGTCSCAASAHLHISAGHSSVAHIMPHHASETWLLVALQLFGSLDAATRCTGFAGTHSGAGEAASPSGYLAAVSVAREAASLSLHCSMPVFGAVRLFLSASRVLAL